MKIKGNLSLIIVTLYIAAWAAWNLWPVNHTCAIVTPLLMVLMLVNILADDKILD